MNTKNKLLALILILTTLLFTSCKHGLGFYALGALMSVISLISLILLIAGIVSSFDELEFDPTLVGGLVFGIFCAGYWLAIFNDAHGYWYYVLAALVSVISLIAIGLFIFGVFISFEYFDFSPMVVIGLILGIFCVAYWLTIFNDTHGYWFYVLGALMGGLSLVSVVMIIYGISEDEFGFIITGIIFIIASVIYWITIFKIWGLILYIVIFALSVIALVCSFTPLIKWIKPSTIISCILSCLVGIAGAIISSIFMYNFWQFWGVLISSSFSVALSWIVCTLFSLKKTHSNKCKGKKGFHEISSTGGRYCKYCGKKIK